MYKYFVRSELKQKGPHPEPAQEVGMNEQMGLIGKIEEHRKKLEDLYNSNGS